MSLQDTALRDGILPPVYKTHWSLDRAETRLYKGPK